MGIFRQCDCSWCAHSRYKLLSYLNCKNINCKSIGYFNRVSRIDIKLNSIQWTCGFMCNVCSEIAAERITEQKKSSNQLALQMCRCELCISYRNVYEIFGYCRTCDSNRSMSRVKRVEKFHDKIIKRCGFICHHCSFFHIEIQKTSNRSIGKVNCFGL